MTMTTTTTTTERQLILRDLASGSCAGAFTIIVVHPLDNLRTRMQVLDVNSSPRQVILTLQQREGIRALYKGLTVPFLAQGVYKAVIFSTVGITKRFLTRHQPLLNPHVSAGICGGIAGCVNSFVVTPVEMIRNRQMLTTTAKFATPFEAAKHAIQHHGPLGLYRGLPLTMLRDGIGLGFWFMTFNGIHLTLKERFGATPSSQNKHNNSIIVPPPPLILVAMSGAAAGLAFWTTALPLDALKSHVQNGNTISSFFSPGRKYYRGYSIAAPRGIIAAAITFTVQYQVLQWLS
jgi:solute carrier family 25 carnitine/acylcarnitine transporter 20/29